RQFRILVQRLRHQRSGLRGRGKRRHTSRNTRSELEKFPAFHFFPPPVARDAKRVSLLRDERVLNRAFMFAARAARRKSREGGSCSVVVPANAGTHNHRLTLPERAGAPAFAK